MHPLFAIIAAHRVPRGAPSGALGAHPSRAIQPEYGAQSCGQTYGQKLTIYGTLQNGYGNHFKKTVDPVLTSHDFGPASSEGRPYVAASGLPAGWGGPRERNAIEKIQNKGDKLLRMLSRNYDSLTGEQQNLVIELVSGASNELEQISAIHHKNTEGRLGGAFPLEYADDWRVFPAADIPDTASSDFINDYPEYWILDLHRSLLEDRYHSKETGVRAHLQSKDPPTGSSDPRKTGFLGILHLRRGTTTTGGRSVAPRRSRSRSRGPPIGRRSAVI